MKVIPDAYLEQSGFSARIELDPAQPYLNDHRPGGDPLLGTVMGIEALARFALLLAPGMNLRAIEAVENHAPFVLRANVPPVLEALLIHDPLQKDHCAVQAVSTAPGGAQQTHLRARLLLAPKLDVHLCENAPEFPCEEARVHSQDIYEVFFHGSAFQVIGAAWWDGARLFARSAQGLLPCFDKNRSTVAAPRLIELALQAAGLLEIASNRRMMIPHTIRRIERFSDLDVDCGRTFWAVASSGSAGGDGPQGLNIDVFDDEQELHLRVRGYQTLALPFAVDSAGLARLQRSFL